MVNRKIKFDQYFHRKLTENENEKDKNIQVCNFCNWSCLYHSTRMHKHINNCVKFLNEGQPVCPPITYTGSSQSSYAASLTRSAAVDFEVLISGKCFCIPERAYIYGVI